MDGRGLHSLLSTFAPRALFPRIEKQAVQLESISGMAASDGDAAALLDDAGNSVIRLVELLIERAHSARASDLHLDPVPGSLSVRERIDGALTHSYRLPLTLHSEIISRIKILSGLRIDEHYAAQDGRFRLSLARGSIIDVRVSIVPTYHGENAVLRLLSDSAQMFSLQSLGLSERDHSVISRALDRPHGMILATGPTGSGKTTTLYTLLQLLNAPDVSIITLEDPIEYSIAGVRQIQVNAKTGLTFGNGLRSILRQDPDIIMVGEVRDRETAGLAINAALTGHRVLSTLHTNDAPSTVTRLLDMGVEPYLIASTVSVIIAQRLVRLLCGSCKIPHDLSHEKLPEMRHLAALRAAGPAALFREGPGCGACLGAKFLGRIGLYEVMEMTPAARDAIVRRVSASELQSIAEHEGMSPLLFDGFRKSCMGDTGISEILKLRYE